MSNTMVLFIIVDYTDGGKCDLKACPGNSECRIAQNKTYVC